MGFECVSRTHVGLRRKVNEDSVLVRTPRGLWAVADGMGGHDAGEVASATVTEALSHLPLCESLDEATANVLQALHGANDALISLARSGGRPRTIGSTVVGLTISNNRFSCWWAGDSRAYQLRGDRLTQLTRDHSLVQELVDAGMLRREEAEDHPNSNVVTRAVGVSASLRPDIVNGDVRAEDVFLLASDGLTRVVPDDEIAAELLGNPIDAAADRLLELVLSRGAPDNVSLVIVRLS